MFQRDEEYRNFQSRANKLVGFYAENNEVRDSDSYDVVVQIIVKLLPPDEVDLYPDGFPEGIYLT